MNQLKKVCVFGASNVDITGFTKDKLIYKDANIGTMQTTAGGVGRNIAENLSKLNFKVSLISVFGDDLLSDFVIDNCKKNKINIDNSLFLKNKSASTFIAIMDKQNDLALGISAMQIYDDLQDEIFINSLPDKINSEYIVLETNLSENILETIVNKYPDKKFILDTVSGKKALKSIPVLPNLYILKTNLLEAKMMSNLQVKSEEDKRKLVAYFLNKGVKKVFITLGKDGVVFGDNSGIYRFSAKASNVINTIGAGDSFIAGLVYADSIKKHTKDMATIAMVAATITVECTHAVSKNMSIENILKRL